MKLCYVLINAMHRLHLVVKMLCICPRGVAKSLTMFGCKQICIVLQWKCFYSCCGCHSKPFPTHRLCRRHFGNLVEKAFLDHLLRRACRAPSYRFLKVLS